MENNETNNLDSFLEVCIIFKTLHTSFELPQMIYSTIVSNNLKNSDILNMTTEEWIDCMSVAIQNERDEIPTQDFINKFLNGK